MHSLETTQILKTLQAIKDPAELTEIARYAQHYSVQRAKMALRLGQRVKFTARHGQTIEGVLTAYNLKTCNVQTAQGKWRVSPQMLQAA